MSDKYYFGKNVDEAILKIKKAKSQAKKNKIFVETVMPAFEKLASYHYHKLPVVKNPEIMQDCLVDLYESINKFDEKNHERGFPYFNMIARNFFIRELKRQKREVEDNKYSVNLIDYQSQKGKIDDVLVEDVEEKIETTEFIEIFKENLYKWKKYYKKEQEQIVLNSLITLFENADNIDIYSKKAVLWYLREMTDLNSKQISMNLNKFYSRFMNLKKKYNRGDI